MLKLLRRRYGKVTNLNYNNMSNTKNKSNEQDEARNYFNNLLLGFANTQQVATKPKENDKRKSVQHIR